MPYHCTAHTIVATSYFIANSHKQWLVNINSDYYLEDFCVYFDSVPRTLVTLLCCGSKTCMATLIKLLQTQHSLQSLGIQQFLLDDSNIKLLCDYLKQNTSITSLDIIECDLSEGKLAILGDMLAVNSMIIYLDIYNTKFTVDDFIHFIELIKANNSLKQITVKQEFQNHSKVKECIQNINHSRNFKLELITYRL